MGRPASTIITDYMMYARAAYCSVERGVLSPAATGTVPLYRKCLQPRTRELNRSPPWLPFCECTEMD